MTRKRYKKLLMALGLQRNEAEEAARDVARCRECYEAVFAEICLELLRARLGAVLALLVEDVKSKAAPVHVTALGAGVEIEIGGTV